MNLVNKKAVSSLSLSLSWSNQLFCINSEREMGSLSWMETAPVNHPIPPIAPHSSITEELSSNIRISTGETVTPNPLEKHELNDLSATLSPDQW